MCTSESNIEELGQYVRRLCLRIESVPVVENETCDDVFSNVLDVCKKGNINIPENDIDCAHRIGKLYVDNTSKKQCQPIIEIHLFSKAHIIISGKEKYKRR